MQNEIRKTEKVFPLLKRAVKSQQQSSFHPFQTCVEQSPKCLIENHDGPCTHRNCLMAYKKPKMFGISISEFYNQKSFREFDVLISDHQCLKDHSHIIPHNPNPGSGDGFEIFRQSMNAVLYLAGEWPVNLKVVPREHVVIKWTEHMDEYPFTNPKTLETKWLQRLDVQEYAFYTGPLENLESRTIDVSIIQNPTIGYTVIDCWPKGDWCHCASESDWCGEGCHQPQNKESVLALEKGGRDEK